MTQKHKVTVAFTRNDANGPNWTYETIEYWQDSNKKNLIRFLKNRANSTFYSSAFKIMWSDGSETGYIRHGTLWYHAKTL